MTARASTTFLASWRVLFASHRASIKSLPILTAPNPNNFALARAIASNVVHSTCTFRALRYWRCFEPERNRHSIPCLVVPFVQYLCKTSNAIHERRNRRYLATSRKKAQTNTFTTRLGERTQTSLAAICTVSPAIGAVLSQAQLLIRETRGRPTHGESDMSSKRQPSH